MAKTNRLSLQEVLTDTPELNPVHVNDFHFCTSGAPFFEMERDIEKNPDIFKTSGFSLRAAQTAPKSIRYRQRDCDWPLGKKGDYMFVDRNGGKMNVPYQVFKRLFV